MSDSMTAEEASVFADTHWRGKMESAAHASLLRADSGLPVVKEMFARLMRGVPPPPPWGNADGLAALRQLRRIVRVMDAFAGLSHEQREILHGHVPITPETYNKPGNQLIEILVRMRSEVWSSNVDLAELRAEIDAETESAAEAARQRVIDHDAVLAAAEQRRNDAPSLVISMHQAGLRLDVDEDGRTVIFPASLMTDEQKSFLATHGREMADAIRSERVTAG